MHLLLPAFWLLQLLLSQRTPLNAYVYSDQYWSPLLDLLPASNTTLVPQVGGSRLTASGQPIDRVGLIAGLIACLRCAVCARSAQTSMLDFQDIIASYNGRNFTAVYNTEHQSWKVIALATPLVLHRAV